METNTITIESNNAKVSFKEEGRSRLTPFQAIFLFELGVSAYCVRNKESQPTLFARLDFINQLIKAEEDHPDWHFEDFKDWVRETTWDTEK